MNHSLMTQKSFKVLVRLVLGLIISLGWWSLAAAGSRPDRTNLWVSLLIVLGGFLPALIAIGLIKLTRGIQPTRLAVNFWGVMGFAAYPVLITSFYFHQLLTGQLPSRLVGLFHPAVLVFNLMAALLIGPIGDYLGFKDRATEYLRAKFPQKQGKLIALLTWWAWHWPFIFLNGSALSALGLSDGLLAAYLATILVLSYFLSWGYDRKRRLVLLTAFKHY